MPIAVAGMHRSGTSMVAKLLHVGGVYLGREPELAAPAPDNASGFWEDKRFVDLNSEVLRACGGSWDSPPTLPRRFDGERYAHLRSAAQTLIGDFEQHEPWGWKDPRNSLTLPFWASIVDDLFTVVCVRNPIEVAISLHRRNSLSYSLGIALWDEYNRRLLDATAPERRVVTHYGAYFEDAAREVERLLNAVGRPATADVVERSVEASQARLRHTTFASSDLLDAEISPESLALYARLCDEAGWIDGPRLSLPEPPRSRVPFLGRRRRRTTETPKANEAVIEVKVLREAHRLDLASLAKLEEHVARLDARAEAAELALESARRQIGERDGVIAALQTELAAVGDWGTRLAEQVKQRDEEIGRIQTALAEMSQWGEQTAVALHERDERIVGLETEIQRVTAELSAGAAALHERDERLVGLETEIQRVTAELSAGAVALLTREGTIAGFEAELAAMREELAASISMRDRLAPEVTRLAELLSTTRGELDRALADADRAVVLDAELAGLREQLNAAVSSLQGREAYVEALSTEAEGLRMAAHQADAGVRAELAHAVERYESQIARLEEQVRLMTERRDANFAETEARDATIRELQAGHGLQLGERDESIRRLQEDVAEISDQAHTLVRDVALRDGTIRQLHVDLATAQATAAAAATNLERQDERLDELEQELGDARRRAEEDAAELEAARAAAEAAALAAEDRIRGLEEELVEVRQRLDDESVALAAARDEAEAASAEARWQTGRIHELEQELAEAGRRAEGEVDALRARLTTEHERELLRRRQAEKKLQRKARVARKRSKRATVELAQGRETIAQLERELAAARERADEAAAEAALREPELAALQHELEQVGSELRDQAVRSAREREEIRRRLEEREAEGEERSRRRERELRELRDELQRREGELRAAREHTDATSAEIRGVHEELDATVRELRRARSELETASADARRAREDLDRAAHERGSESQLHELVEALRETLSTAPAVRQPAAAPAPIEREIVPEKPEAATAPQPRAPVGPRPVPAREAPADYPALRRGVGAIARGVIPSGSSVVVVSRGDDELLREIGAGAIHFPQAESGRYAGYHPGSGGVAINHLEQLMRGGAQFLLFPSTAFWWFDHYRSLREYLEDRHHAVWDDAFCRIYDLRDVRPPRPVEAPGGNGVDVLCFPIIDWSFRFQRPQQIATQFARTGHRVLYFQTRFHQRGDDAIVEPLGENIYEVQLPGPDHLNLYEHTMSDAERDQLLGALDRLRRRLQISDAISVVDLPFWTPVALAARKRWGWRVVYDCMDDHSGFSTVRAEMLESEDELVHESDLLLTTSHLLYEKMSPKASRTLLLPNAADVEHFSTPTDLKPLAHLPRPVVGYYGAISDWFDTEMILKAALARRDWTFVLVGDTFGADVEGLRALENVHLLGEQPYRTLPSYLQSFDVACIPFLITPLTEATNPVKFYEYLSAGKPVVSVDLPELEPYRDYYYSAKDSQSFVRQVERSLAENSNEQASDRRDFARRNSWAQRYELLGSALRSTYGKAAIVILSFDNLAYLRLCLESIWANTQYPNYEVIVVDNASSQPVVDYLQRAAEQEPRLRLILNDENLGFARANNQGLEAAADADYLFLLNDDTVVTRGWLGKLVRYLRDERIGLVGPVSNWAGNEAKIEVSYSDVGQMPAFAEQRVRDHAGESFDIDMLAMYCVGMRREVLEKVGYLNERFGIGMFEDDDFSMRVRKAWYRVVCAEDVFVHHWGRASFSRLDEDTYAKLFEQNRKTFEQLWGQEWRPHQHR